MYSLTVSEGFAAADYVNELMKEIDPEGTHSIEKDAEGALQRLQGIDVVWLAANENGFALAKEGRRISPGTNFIFAADRPGMAYDAMKVRASGYVLEPVTEEAVREEIAELRYPIKEDRAKLKIQCFGNFEVFGLGGIVRFARSLSKEALAYLVDRRGAGCTVSEICGVLWENRPIDTNLKSQGRVILSSLKKDLEAVGAGDVLVKGWNTWGIDADKITCDYFDFLRDGDKSHESYCGEYMSQYSWAELTSGSLYQMTNE